MEIDKELYKQAHQWFQEWNEAELIEQALQAGKRSPLESWNIYQDLFCFFQRIHAKPSLKQHSLIIEDLNRYYLRVQKLEAWRCTHGKRH